MGQMGVSLRAAHDKLLVFLGEETDFGALVQGLRQELREGHVRAGCSQVMVDIGKRVISAAQFKELERVIERENGLRLVRIVDSIDMASRPSWWPQAREEVAAASGDAPLPEPDEPEMNCQYIVLDADLDQEDKPPNAGDLSKEQSATRPDTRGRQMDEFTEVPWQSAHASSEVSAAQATARITDGEPMRLAQHNAYIHKCTLRSGQSIVARGDVVVLGDVNPGAEVIASGDVAILGTLRGVAHAGSSGDRDATVTAFRLQPTQLRIAEFVARPPDDYKLKPDKPEIARISDGALVIESLERHLPNRRKGGSAE